jgi:hypothetical protein
MRGSLFHASLLAPGMATPAANDALAGDPTATVQIEYLMTMKLAPHKLLTRACSL